MLVVFSISLLAQNRFRTKQCFDDMWTRFLSGMPNSTVWILGLPFKTCRIWIPLVPGFHGDRWLKNMKDGKFDGDHWVIHKRWVSLYIYVTNSTERGYGSSKFFPYASQSMYYGACYCLVASGIWDSWILFQYCSWLTVWSLTCCLTTETYKKMGIIFNSGFIGNKICL